MDPASATVAFIGFAASIATLAAVVIDSAKTLRNLTVGLSDAPTEVLRLAKKIDRLERIIVEVKKTGEGLKDDASSASLDAYWQEHALEMQKDFMTLQSKIAALSSNFDRKSPSSKRLWARFRVIFSEQDILKYNRIIGEHTDILNFILSMIGECVIPCCQWLG